MLGRKDLSSRSWTTRERPDPSSTTDFERLSTPFFADLERTFVPTA